MPRPYIPLKAVLKSKMVPFAFALSGSLGMSQEALQEQVLEAHKEEVEKRGLRLFEAGCLKQA